MPDVEVSCGDIFDVGADAITSPSNSFAHLNGGIDGIYTRRFGVQLENRLQAYLEQHWDGELPVGCAVIIDIGIQDKYKYLISAPTMRVPMNISGSVNPYMAFRATLQAVKKFNINAKIHADKENKLWCDTEKYIPVEPKVINSILCPGLGTAVGGMDVNIAAFQMRAAYDSIQKPKPIPDLHICWALHESLRRGVPLPEEEDE